MDDVPAGYLLYAPAHLVPRSVAFPTAPVSGDAVLLMTGRVLDEFTGGGIGRMLVQGVAKDLTRRGVRAIEAFGLEHGQPPEGDRYAAAPGCLLPADFLRSVGFKTVRPHHRHPRLRLDLRTTLSWREDVEQAIERLLGTRPAAGAHRLLSSARTVAAQRFQSRLRRRSALRTGAPGPSRRRRSACPS